MLNFKKIVSIVLCIILIIGAFCGCGEKYNDAIIYFELLEKPRTLDPQTAQSDSELLIVRNIYEGLLRKDSDGNIVNGTCESYTYSDLLYTFKLKENLVWSDGTPLTAYDFEYGLSRAVDPKIKAPFASRLFSVEGAEAVYNGTADKSSFGVKAVDEYTVTIKMCREDSEFLSTLTTAVCMPCNQEFFSNSIGKYGLDAEYIVSNGSYRLTKWNKEDFGIRLYKNEEYSGSFQAQNGAVFVNCVEDETQVSRISDGGSDMAFLPCNELDAAENAGFEIEAVQNICWIITVNGNYSSEVRRAFATAFSNDVYSSSLPDGFSGAKSIYPEILGLDADGIGITGYNIDEAKSVMSSQIADMTDSKFPSATLYYYDIDGVKGLATAIVGHWQQNLSTFVNIEGSNNLNALQSEILSPTLDFALFPITATSTSFGEYAAKFISLTTATTPSELQKQLLDGNKIIPVAYQDTNISYISTLENVTAEEDNGYIDFSYVIKR